MIVAQYIFPLVGRSIIAVAIVAAMPLAPKGQRAVTTVVLLCYLKLMLGVMAEIVGQEQHRQRITYWSRSDERNEGERGTCIQFGLNDLKCELGLPYTSYSKPKVCKKSAESLRPNRADLV